MEHQLCHSVDVAVEFRIFDFQAVLRTVFHTDRAAGTGFFIDDRFLPLFFRNLAARDAGWIFDRALRTDFAADTAFDAKVRVDCMLLSQCTCDGTHRAVFRTDGAADAVVSNFICHNFTSFAYVISRRRTVPEAPVRRRR